jgi:hypothetical protein
MQRGKEGALRLLEFDKALGTLLVVIIEMRSTRTKKRSGNALFPLIGR